MMTPNGRPEQEHPQPSPPRPPPEPDEDFEDVEDEDDDDDGGDEEEEPEAARRFREEKAMEDEMATLEQAKKTLEETQKMVAAGHAEYMERTKGAPIPSQAENNLIKLGAPVAHKSGSGAAGPDLATRSMEARPAGGGYTTRAARATTASSS